MAKDKEKQAAYLLYVVQMRSAKETSILVKVQEKTVGEWIKKGNWKAERNARLNTDKQRADKIKSVIDNLSDQSIELSQKLETAKLMNDQKEIFALNTQAVAISQQVAMYNKVLMQIDKDAKVSLEIYIKIMELIFSDLQAFDPGLYMKSLDFQSQHLRAASLKYG